MGVPSVAGTTYSSVLIYDGDPQCSRNDLLFCPRLRRGSLVQQELLILLSSSTTRVPSVAGSTYSSVLVYEGGPQCSRNYLLFCPHLRWGTLVQQELLTLLSSSTTGIPSVAGTTYSSVLVYEGDPLCSRNYLFFCPRLRQGSLVWQDLLTLLSSSTKGSLVQQELLTILFSSTKGNPSVAGTTYSSVLIYDGDPQCIRNYLRFCPRLRQGSLVQQELFTLLSSSTKGIPSVAGTTYSSVLVYEGGPQCSRNYLLFCPRLRRGSLVQQELLTLLSSSTKGVPSVAGTTYSSVLVYDGDPQCSRNDVLFCPRLRRDPQCSRNQLLFCPLLRRGSLVQQELLTLLSSSTKGIPSVAGTTYSSVLVYEGVPSVSGTTYSSVLVYDRDYQCSRNYLLFCPHLRRGSLVQQELLTLLSSSTSGIPSVAGTTYSSVLVYEGDPLCSRNYLFFCPRLRQGSLVQQDLLTLLSSSTKGVSSVAGTTYSSVLIYDGDPQCSRIYLLFCPPLRQGSLVQQELLILLSSSTKGVPSVSGTTYSSVLIYNGNPQCSRNYLLFCPRLRQGSLVQQELLTLLSSSTKGVPSVAGTTYSSVLIYDGDPQCSRIYLLFCPPLRQGIPSVAGTTYSSVLVYEGGPQCIRNYLLFCPHLQRESLVQQELLTLLSSSTTGVPSVAGTTYSSVLVYEGGPQCIRNYLLFCPHLQRESLVQQELLTLLSSSTKGIPCVAGTTYSSVLIYDGDPQCSRIYLLFCPPLRQGIPSVAGTTYSSVLIYEGGPQCSRNYLLFCPHLRRGSLVQQELLTLLSSSTKGIPCVAGTTYSSVLVYDRGPQCSRIYLLFCPRLRRGSLVQQELLTLLSSSTMGIPSVAGSTYSSVLLYDRGPQCSRNYLLFCPHLRRGSLVQQELLTLLSSSTTRVPSVAGTTYSSVLVYEGGPQCRRNYLLFCPHLRRGTLVQQERRTLLSSSTKGIPCVAGTTYSSVFVYDKGPQCGRIYLLFCPRLRRGSLVQQELLTLLSSSTMGVPRVAGTTYTSFLFYDRGPQSRRNYLLFCPHLRRGSLVYQELHTILSSSTTGVPRVAGTTYSSVLIYDGDPQCIRNYLRFCPRLRQGSLVQQALFTLLSSSTKGVPSVAGTTYSSVLVYEGGPQCSRNYLLFCPHLRRGSLVQQELLTLLSSSMKGIPCVAGTTYSSVLVYDRGPQCSRIYLLFCPRLRRGSLVQQELLTLLSSSTMGIPSVAGTTYSSVLLYDRGPQCSRNYLFFCPRLRRGSLVYQELLTLLSSSTTGIPSVAGTTYSSVLVYDRGPQCSRNYLLFCPHLRRGSLVQQELLTLLSSSTTGIPSVAGSTYSSVLLYDRGSLVQQELLILLSSSTKGVPSVSGTTYSSVLIYNGNPQCSRNYLLFCPRLRRRSLVQQELLILLSSSTMGIPSVAGSTYSSVLLYDRGSLVQQELLTLLSSSTKGVPSVAGTTYSSVLIYDGDPQCSRNYLLFCPRLRRGSLVQQELLILLSSSTTGVPSVAGSTYSSVLVYEGGLQCSRNYLLFCPHLRWGSLVQQDLLTLLSSSTTGVPSVAGTTYSSVLIYDGDPQCSKNYLRFCPRLRQGSLVQQELLILLSSSTKGVHSVEGTTYSSVLIYDGEPQCSRNDVLFCPHLRRGSLVQQELLILLSSSTTRVPSVAGSTYSSVLVYEGGPQCSRNYSLFCPRLRWGSLEQQERRTLLSSSTTGVPRVGGTTYSSVLI